MAKHEYTETSKTEKCPECRAPIVEEYGGKAAKALFDTGVQFEMRVFPSFWRLSV